MSDNIFSEDVRRAFQALKRLTAEDRTYVLCWFCSFCGADIPPGKGPCHDSAGRKEAYIDNVIEDLSSNEEKIE